MNHAADLAADLAEAYELADRPDDATRFRQTALGLYERKGNVVMAARLSTGETRVSPVSPLL